MVVTFISSAIIATIKFIAILIACLSFDIVVALTAHALHLSILCFFRTRSLNCSRFVCLLSFFFRSFLSFSIRPSWALRRQPFRLARGWHTHPMPRCYRITLNANRMVRGTSCTSGPRLTISPAAMKSETQLPSTSQSKTGSEFSPRTTCGY